MGPFYCNAVKYILSNNYKLKQESTSSFLLIKQSGTIFEVNKKIFYFLTLFTEPLSENQLLDQYSQQSNISSPPENKEITSFFESMKNRKIIVPFKNELYQARELTLKYEPCNFYRQFKIEKLISKNGFTEVYEVSEFNKKYILKLIHLPEQISTEDENKIATDFRNEDQLYTQAQDNNYFVTPIYSSVKDLVFVFPKFEGIPLFKFVYNKNLSPLSKATLIKHMINGVAILHASKIIHGDLHYGNILVSDCTSIRIIDFDLSSTDAIINSNKGGYYPFLAPEQINKSNFDYHKGQTTYQTDVYQIGVLCYYILFEKLPFYSDHWDQLYDLIQSNSPIWPNNSLLEKEIEITKKCLDKNLKFRPRNAIELLTDTPRLP